MAYNLAQTLSAINASKPTKFIDVRSWVSWYGATKLFGQGLSIDSPNPEIKEYLRKWLAKEKFEDRMIQICFDTNYWGRTIMTLDRFEDGHIGLSYTNNEILQIVNKIEIRPFSASLLMRKAVGLVIWYMQATYTDNWVYRTITYDAGKGVSIYNQGVGLSPAVKASFPKEFRLPEKEYHGLGFVPIVEIANKPASNVINTNSDIDRLRDDWYVKDMAYHINHGLNQMLKEEELGKTRGYGRIAESTLDNWQQTGQGGLLSDFFIETTPLGDTNKAFEIEAGTYDGLKWLEPSFKKINLYFMGCGYSKQFKESTDPTEAETLYSKDQDMATMKIKRRRYTEFLNDLFKRLLVYAGYMTSIDDDAPFTLEIKESVVYNKLQLSEYIVYNIQNALMTRAEAISLQRDINLEEAEEVIKEIDKDQEQIMEKQAQVLEMNAEAETQMGEGTGSDEADPKSDE